MSSTITIVGVPRAATLLGLSGGRVRQLLASGDLAGQKLHERAWAIPVTEIDRFKALREKSAANRKIR